MIKRGKRSGSGQNQRMRDRAAPGARGREKAPVAVCPRLRVR
jgi:hypothetical protein